jgi:hypothetical protein
MAGTTYIKMFYICQMCSFGNKQERAHAQGALTVFSLRDSIPEVEKVLVGHILHLLVKVKQPALLHL